jgi:hypothetical protein
VNCEIRASPSQTIANQRSSTRLSDAQNRPDCAVHHFQLHFRLATLSSERVMHCKASGGYYGPEPQRLPERKHLSCLSCLSCMWCFDCLVRLGSVQHPGIEPIQHSAGAFPVGQCRIYRRNDIKRSRRNAGVCLVILRCSLRVRYCVRSRLRKTSWIVPLIVISGVLCAALSLCCDALTLRKLPAPRAHPSYGAAWHV